MWVCSRMLQYKYGSLGKVCWFFFKIQATTRSLQNTQTAVIYCKLEKSDRRRSRHTENLLIYTSNWVGVFLFKILHFKNNSNDCSIDNFISKGKTRFLRMSISFCCTHCSLTSALSNVNVHNKTSEGILLETTTPKLR